MKKDTRGDGMKKRDIPLKNYFILFGIIVISILIIFLFLRTYTINQQYKNNHIINKVLSEINYDELENHLMENPDMILYVAKHSLLNKDFEIKFKEYISLKGYSKDIVYINMSLVDRVFWQFLNDLRSDELVSRSYKIDDVPNIIVFENRKVVKVLNDNSNILKIDDVSGFLEEVLSD